jgi:transcriptional regulator with XRE-family HTH domain
MAKKTASLLPSSELLLVRLGERLRLARLRRQLSAKQVAERAGMTPMTLRGLERGGSGVTIGAYLAVMQVLGIDRDIDLLAKEDAMGHALQDSRLPRSKSRDNTIYKTPEQLRLLQSIPQTRQTAAAYDAVDDALAGGLGEDGFSSAELAALLDQAAPKRGQ